MLSPLSLGVAVLALARFVAGVPTEKRSPAPWSTFNDNGVFYPAENYTSWRTLYARTLQLPDDSILLTWEDYDPNVPEAYWPIYKSTDGGVSFQNFSRVYDTVNGFGNWYQPNLYALPKAFGGYPAGTILIVGASTPRNLSAAYLDMYASTDQGASWEFVSHIVYGAGPELTTDGDKAVWEPFLYMYHDKLICYYSDQTNPKYAQRLVHKTTKDLKTWSRPVNDVAMPTYSQRPGMTTMAHSPISGLYVMTFEYCGGPLTSGCPVYFKSAKSPLEFGKATPYPIYPSNPSANPNGNPYIIWTPSPGSNGTSGVFLMDGDGNEDIFVNTDDADPSAWQPVTTGQWSAYSRSLRVINTPKNTPDGGSQKLLIANGGNIGCSGSCYNYVATGVIDIPTYPNSS